eukprot:6185150-Pleurochrysis_carterae.AAC.4
MTAMMTLVAFASGRVQTFEGFEARQFAKSGLGATAAFQRTKVVTAGASRRMFCDHLLLSYTVMAAVILLSAQPTTHARLANLWRTVWEGAQVIGRGSGRAAEARRNLLHGLATCGMLLVLMAFINYGDAAFTNHFVRNRGASKTESIYTAAMQSMPTGSMPTCAKAMWLGDTGAEMHCVTNVAMAVEGSVRANITLIMTANGTTWPKYRCKVDLPLRTTKGHVTALRLTNILVLDNASHNLVSLGRLERRLIKIELLKVF